MQPSGTLHHDEVAEKMMDLTKWLLAEQRLLKKEHMIAHVIATDGEIDCGETIMFLISILDDALVPLNADTLLPSSKADVTEAESRRDERRMQAMAVRAGANLYMNVLQQLPIPLSEETERRTLKRIELVMLEALASPFEVMHGRIVGDGVSDCAIILLRKFDAQLRMLLAETRFEDLQQRPPSPQERNSKGNPAGSQTCL